MFDINDIIKENLEEEYNADFHKHRDAMIKGFYRFTPIQMDEMRNKDKNQYYKDFMYYKVMTQIKTEDK